eukprot:scaffold34634_cov27-Prasinocladus_malaysianus.AAC.1
MRRLILKFPRAFEYSVDDKVVPAVEFYEELGLNQQQVKRIMQIKPQALLCHNINKTVRPR